MSCKYKNTNCNATIILVIVLGLVLCGVIVAYISFGDNNNEEGLRTLCMISIVFKHGERTATELYSNDPFNNYNRYGGMGALTTKGILQMFNLGRNLRNRYYRLLPQSGLYSKNEIHVLSNYAESSLMSAQSLLAGFILPLENRNILPISWQPVAINPIPRNADFLLAQEISCPRYENALDKLNQNPSLNLQKLNKDNRQLYEYLSQHTGKNITTISDVELIYIMKKIKGVPLLTEIHNNMINKKTKLKPDRKIFLYSGYDTTLVNVMNSLNLIPEQPDFASSLVFELHHSYIYKNDLEVKLVYYYNSDDKFPTEINIPNCDHPCSLKQFSETIKPLLLLNFDETCRYIARKNGTCMNISKIEL